VATLLLIHLWFVPDLSNFWLWWFYLPQVHAPNASALQYAWSACGIAGSSP
jgi:hypothetical protein